jgi:hypothetical protein
LKLKLAPEVLVARFETGSLLLTRAFMEHVSCREQQREKRKKDGLLV